jgi:hypothetical protein
MKYEIWSNMAGRSKEFREANPDHSQFFNGYKPGAPMMKSYEAPLWDACKSFVIIHPEIVLERLFEMFNADSRPNGRVAHSLSIGDVVVLDTNARTAYSVESRGFKEVENFEPVVFEC